MRSGLGTAPAQAPAAAFHRYAQSAEPVYARVVAAAFREVPYYRECLMQAGGVLDVPPTLPAAALAGQLPRLYPLREPLQAQGELPPFLGHPRDLYESLLLTEAYAPRRPVFELRAALLDWRHLGPRRRGTYRAVLSATATVHRGIERRRADTATLLSRGGYLIGDPDEVAGYPRAFLRRPPTGGPVPAGDVAGVLLHDPYLGYLGAWARSCGRAHVNTRRVHARVTRDGVVFSKLRQRRPTLIAVLPTVTATGAELCPVHGTPVLVG